MADHRLRICFAVEDALAKTENISWTSPVAAWFYVGWGMIEVADALYLVALSIHEEKQFRHLADLHRQQEELLEEQAEINLCLLLSRGIRRQYWKTSSLN